MQDIINVAVNNGLGICSFVALLYFIFTIDKENNENQKALNDTLKEINSSMIEVQITLVKQNERLTDIENKINKKEVD